MSTYVELRSRVQRRIGRVGFTIDNEFLDEMKAAQEKLEQRPQLPKFLKTTTGDLPTVSGNTILTALPPTDFIRVYDDFSLVYDDEDGKEKGAIRLDTRQQLISKKNAGISGEIYYFLPSKTEVEIAPELTRDTTFRMTYYATDDVLTGSNENLWTAQLGELIMAMAGMEIAVWLRDDRALAYFSTLHDKERAMFLRQVEADEWGDMDLTMGGPD